MTASKKSDLQALIPLVEELIAKEPHEAFGTKWAARPQSYYCEKLGVSVSTLFRRIREPPFVRRSEQIDEKPKLLWLLRVDKDPPRGTSLTRPSG